jgi:predicted metal-dependent hydrolase
MSSASSHLTIAGLGVDVVYKDIKNMHISVYPPAGRIRVAAPHRVNEDAIRLAVIQRLPWIKRQRQQLLSAPRQTERQMVSGETHYVWGQRYRLDTSRTGRPQVTIQGPDLFVTAPAGSDTEAPAGILDRWYRRQVKEALPPLLDKWQPVVGVDVDKIVVRRMKTKWGSCQTDSRSIWVNPELAKKNPLCLEYIVVHELTHFHERTHNEKFIALLDAYLPDWRSRRELLNGAPLSDEKWDCED